MLLQNYPKDFVEWLQPGATFLESLPTELPRESLYADALLKILYLGIVYILHLEVQTSADATMPWRLLQYMGLAGIREKVTLLPKVIYLFPTSVPVIPWQAMGPSGPVVTLNFEIIRMWEIPVESWLASPSITMQIFTPLLKGANLETFDQAANTLQQVSDANERGNALNYLTLFAMRKFGQRLVTQHIKENIMLDSFITESEWYQCILKRGTEEGMAQGVAQGVVQGEKTMAQRALEGRFGIVDADILAALNQADEPTLEAIVLHITTDTIEQVRARLGLT